MDDRSEEAQDVGAFHRSESLVLRKLMVGQKAEKNYGDKGNDKCRKERAGKRDQLLGRIGGPDQVPFFRGKRFGIAFGSQLFRFARRLVPSRLI